MGYLIGTDEAGYGPNLGPLVITATVWQVPPGMRAEDLYEALHPAIVPTADQLGPNPNGRVVIADSKLLYRPSKGLAQLERGLWAALAALDQQPDCWSEIWHALAPDSVEAMVAAPWYAEYDAPLPVDNDRKALEPLGPALRQVFAAADVYLEEMLSRAIFPAQWNELNERYDSKGTVLSHLTLELVCRVMAPLPPGPIFVLCDKHGGRNHYLPLLCQHFPDTFIEVRRESRQSSVYRFGPPQRRVEIRFCTNGERHLPTALASMASKYLRELAMLAFNEYWCDRVSGLVPTAGYPQDAQRFKQAIAELQQRLKIDDRLLWRVK